MTLRGGTAVLLLSLVGLAVGCGSEEYDELTIKWYCGYGAVSNAQYRGCVDHVAIEDVEESAAKGRAAGEFAQLCANNYSDPNFDPNEVRSCNSVIP